jgi:hypothetical protein
MRPFTGTLASGLLLLCLTSCSNPNEAVDAKAASPSVIEGVVANWTWSDSMNVSAEITSGLFGAADVDGWGFFHLELAIPPPAALQHWGYSHDTVSDTSARFCQVGLLCISGPSGADRHYAFNASSLGGGYGDPTNFTSVRIYADRQAIVAGFDTLYLTAGAGSAIDTLLVARDLQLASGWNIINRRSRYLRDHFIVWAWRVERTTTANWFLQSPSAT